MVNFKEHQLSNGLKVIIHEDHSSPVVCLNLLYKVGSRNELPHKTGFAHLFEHLMFGGSKNIGNFDDELQKAGGDNNAFTNPDITNYYITIPSSNVETAFWLESDRMLSLSFDPEVLEIQRKVVVEEFKQRYLNQPYGDVWLKLRPVAYEKHPYRWPTIGKEPKHIEDATMDDVKSFFKAHYHPGNAVLVIAGDITDEKALRLTEKWFGQIPAGNTSTNGIVTEPPQKEARRLEVKANVPSNTIYKTYHMPGRTDKTYHQADLLSDVLGRGKSSLLHQQLVRNNHYFSNIGAHITGSYDPGLLVIIGKLNDDVAMEDAEQAIQKVVDQVKNEISATLLNKVKNQSEAAVAFAEVDLLNRAMGLAYAAFLGDPNLINEEIEQIKAVTSEEVVTMANNILRESNCTTLYYLKNEA